MHVALVAKYSATIKSFDSFGFCFVLPYFGKRWYPQLSSAFSDLVTKIEPKMSAML